MGHDSLFKLKNGEVQRVRLRMGMNTLQTPKRRTPMSPGHQAIIDNHLSEIDEVISKMTSAREEVLAGSLLTSESALLVAKAVSEATELLKPKTIDLNGGRRVGLVANSVRIARDPSHGKKATLNTVAKALGLSSASRASDLFGDGKAKREEDSKARNAKFLEEHPRPPKPMLKLDGLSMGDAEEHFSCSRTKIRRMAARGDLLGFLSRDPKTGNLVTLNRGGRDFPVVRYLIDGLSAATAAEKLEVSVSEVEERGEKGLLGRSRVLDNTTFKPITGADGNPVWQYFS